MRYRGDRMRVFFNYKKKTKKNTDFNEQAA